MTSKILQSREIHFDINHIKISEYRNIFIGANDVKITEKYIYKTNHLDANDVKVHVLKSRNTSTENVQENKTE